jgi:hypothetical protein
MSSSKDTLLQNFTTELYYRHLESVALVHELIQLTPNSLAS